MMRPMNATPPTDPPTMAPTWEVVEAAVLLGDGVLLVAEVLVGRVTLELVVGEELVETAAKDGVAVVEANAPTPVNIGVGFTLAVVVISIAADLNSVYIA